LGLGYHTVDLVVNSVGYTALLAYDIITPIHINSSNLKLGNLSLMSNSKISPNKVLDIAPDMSVAKAWLTFDLANAKILASHNISSVFITSTGNIYAFFERPFKTTEYVGLCSSSTFEARSTSVEKYHNFMNVAVANSSGTGINSEVYLACFGELIDE
jgi:hypothetical protein